MDTLKKWFVGSPLGVVAALVAAFSAVGIASADTSGSNAPPPTPVTTVGELQAVFCSFIGYFFWTVMIISIIFVLVAAFHYVTAGDDTEKTSKARRTLTYAAIGIVVALVAIGVPNIVASLFPGQPNIAVAGMCGF